MEPGNDQTHFCMPTSVAVSESTGDFFVADGYCNSRVMKFNKDGKLLKIISMKFFFYKYCFFHEFFDIWYISINYYDYILNYPQPISPGPNYPHQISPQP